MPSRSGSPPIGWFTAGGAGFLAVCIAMLATVPSEDRFTAVCAIVNLALILGISWLALRRHAVYGSVIASYLLPMGLQVAIATLYFCFFNPRFYVYIGETTVAFLPMNWRFQLATMVYVCAAGFVWLTLSPSKSKATSHSSYKEWSKAADAMSMPSFGAFTLIVAVLVALKFMNINEDSFGGYVVFGFFRFCLSLPMLCGATWKQRTRLERIVVSLVLLANGGFNILTNNRSIGFFPILYFGFGLLFLGDLSTRRKMQSLVVVTALFVTIMIFGDLGRQLKMDIWRGGYESLADRIDKLSQSTDALDVGQDRWADRIFLRLFTLGGFQITTLMPETVPYKPFSLPVYALEVVSQGVLPRAFAIRLVEPVYEEKSTLIAFGYRLVHKRHSVERYCIGAAWELGGYAAELCIGALTGLILVWFMRTTNLVAATAPMFAVVLVAVVIDRLTGATTEGIPSLLHDMVYTFPVGFCIFIVSRLVSAVPPFRSAGSAHSQGANVKPRPFAIGPTA
ncbi:MAG: hypothetical protein HQ464_15955 [Planctomycetes bacterium]|nr:hypothetical protein [Planctomycetota bacterium]